MTKNFLLIILVLMTTSSFSYEVVTAELKKNLPYFLSSFHKLRAIREKKIYFPEEKYNIHNLEIYVKTIASNYSRLHRLIALPKYYYISTNSSNIILENFNSQTGHFKYKLSIIPSSIVDAGNMVVEPKILPLKIIGNAIFNANQKDYMYIEGIAKIHNDKLTILNIHTNSDNSSFDLEPANDGTKTIWLKPLTNTSLTIRVSE